MDKQQTEYWLKKFNIKDCSIKLNRVRVPVERIIRIRQSSIRQISKRNGNDKCKKSPEQPSTSSGSNPISNDQVTQSNDPKTQDFLDEMLRKSKQLKPTPHSVTFVYESFKVEKVNLKNASERIIHPAHEDQNSGWPHIHSEINKMRHD